MGFANKYFEKFKSFPEFINNDPESDLNIITVIPCYNEPDLRKSLYSLYNCNRPKSSVEIIVVINSGENSDKEIIIQNNKTYKEAIELSEKISDKKFKFHVINITNLPEKYAGVGFARKIGMDEAVRRFDKINKSSGIITGFDADSYVEKNYFTEIEKFFAENNKANACSIHFEHPIVGNEFDKDIYSKIIKYELHLRYFINSLRKINYPFAFQTIGSSFAVKADIYTKQGGMNKKKAGEDFYFLQKIIQLGSYYDLNTTKIIPSPRISDRVPFGTGAAIKKMQENNETEYYTYNNKAFKDLDILFKNKLQFYKSFNTENLNQSIIKFFKINNFENDLIKIRDNSPNHRIFIKRFYDWFNTFKIIKYLNFVHENYYEKINTEHAVKELLTGKTFLDNELISEKELLIYMRTADRKTYYNPELT